MGRFWLACRLSFTLLLSALVLFPTTAFAQAEVTFHFLSVTDSNVFADLLQLSENSGFSYTGDLHIGRYRGKIETGNAFNIFCTDLPHSINEAGDAFDTLAVLGKVTAAAQPFNHTEFFYESGNGGTPGGLKSALNAADYNPTNFSGTFNDINKRVQAVAWLGNEWLNNPITADQAAGVQLAIWDILQDGGDGLGAGSGTFRARGSGGGLLPGAVLTAYNTAIGEGVLHTNWSPPGTDNTYYIQAERNSDNAHDHKQEFMYAVPEPVFYQLGALLGLGAIGMIRIRRRSR